MNNLRARLNNFWYFRKKNFFNVLHRIFPSLHEYQWAWVLDCGCCGFDGVYCMRCESKIIIGHAAYSSEVIESGDYQEYGI